MQYLKWVKHRARVDYGLPDLVALEFGPPEESHGVWVEAQKTESLPFGETLRCLIRNPPPKPYAHTLRVPILEPLKKDESFLLTVWARSFGLENAEIAHAVERGREPFDKLFWCEEIVGPGWKQWWLPFVALEDYEAGDSRYQLLFQRRPQEVELGGLALFRVGRHEARLPDSRVYSPPKKPASKEKPDEFHTGLLDGFSTHTHFLSYPQQVATLESLVFNRGEGEIQTVRGSGFSHSLRYRFDEEGSLMSTLPGQFKSEDSLALFASLRTPHEEGGLVSFDLSSADRTQPIFRWSGPVSTNWSHVCPRFRPIGPLPTAPLILQIQIHGDLSEIEIAGLALISYEAIQDQKEERNEYLPPVRPLERRIDSVRRQNLSLQVLDSSGHPVPNVRVSITQTSHSFGLGTCVRLASLLSSQPDQLYKTKLHDVTGAGKGFNRACPEWRLTWQGWESASSSERSHTVQALRELSASGLRLKGHYIVSGNLAHLPSSAYMLRKAKKSLAGSMKQRLEQVLSAPEFENLIEEWDLFNEPYSIPEIISIVGEDAVIALFQRAAELRPQTRFFLNENHLLSVGGLSRTVLNSTRRLMEKIRDNTSCRLGLGLQGHFRGYLPSNRLLEKVISELSDPGWELRISELDITGVTELEAAAFTDRLLTILMGSKSVSGLDLWGFWDGKSWCDDALIFRRDWSTKPSGRVYLKRFFEDWWTDLELHTDDRGVVETRVFQGRHRLALSTERAATTQTLVVDRQDLDLKFVLPENQPDS